MIAVAWAALILWPLVAIVLFRKYSLPTAFCVTIVGGYLLLPTKVGLDLPALPRLDKDTIPALSALVLTMIALGRRRPPGQAVAGPRTLPGWLPRNLPTLGLMALLFVGTFGTALTNRDLLFYGDRVLPSMSVYDGFSFLLSTLLLLIPFVLARRVLASRTGQRTLLVTLAVSAVAYAWPALWEVRMSPQLNVQIYGFFQHSFLQHMRQGGYRPVVFLSHGLMLSIFLSLALIAAVGLFRTAQGPRRRLWAAAAGFLSVTLVLSKSLGALVIALLLVPVALLARPRVQILVAACIAGTVLFYPVLRATHLVPVQRIAATALSISPERAQSFNVRVHNEEILLAKAEQRSLFGWGGWNRNRVFDEHGRDISITDGTWILELGVGGWTRYIAIFGLLCWPLIALALDRRGRIDPICGILALLLAGKLLDLLPNSGLSPVMWLTAGALLGRLEMSRTDLRDTAADPALVPAVHGPVYARTPDDTAAAPRRSPTPDPDGEAGARRYTRYAYNGPGRALPGADLLSRAARQRK